MNPFIPTINTAYLVFNLEYVMVNLISLYQSHENPTLFMPIAAWPEGQTDRMSDKLKS